MAESYKGSGLSKDEYEKRKKNLEAAQKSAEEFKATGGTQIIVDKSTGQTTTVLSGVNKSKIEQFRQQGQIQPVQPQEIISSLLAKQGKPVSYDSKGNIITVENGQKVVISPTGDVIKSPSTATTRPEFIRAMAMAQAEKAQQQAHQQTPQEPYSSGAIMHEYKPSVEEKVQRYIENNQGQYGGIIAGTAYTGYRAIRSGAQAFVSVFKPSTYVNMGKQGWQLITSAKAREDFRNDLYGFGGQLKQEPYLIGDVAGSYAGSYLGFKLIGKGIKALKKPVIVSKSGEIVITQETPQGVSTKAAGAYKVKVGGKTYTIKAAGKEISVPISDNQATSLGAVKAASGKTSAQAMTQGVKLIKEDAVYSIDKFRAGVAKGSKINYQFGVSASKSQPLVSGEGLDVYYTKGIDAVYKQKVGRLFNVKKDFNFKFTAEEALRKGKPTNFYAGLTKEIAKRDQVTISQAKFEDLQSMKFFKQAKGVKSNIDLTSSGERLKLLKQSSGSTTVSGMRLLTKQTAKILYMKEPVHSFGYPKVIEQPKAIPVSNIRVINKQAQQLAEKTKSMIETKNKTMIKTYRIQQPKILMPVKIEIGNIAKDMQRTYTRQESLQRSAIKEELIQENVLKQEQIQEPVLKQELVSKTVRTMKKPMFNIKEFGLPSLMPKNYHGRMVQAYDVLFKRGKSYYPVPKGTGLPIGRGLKVGSQYLLQNLRASFKLRPSGFTLQEDINYNPDVRIFRDYRIIGGQRVHIPNLYIQREGKRLISSSEVSEIQAERKKKKWRLPSWK